MWEGGGGIGCLCGGFKRIRRRMLRCPRLGTNELKFRIIMTKKIIEKIIAIIIISGGGGADINDKMLILIL